MQMEKGPSALIKNARLICPASELDRTADLLILGGMIAEIGSGISFPGETLDAQGLCCAPGLVDMHCHLREPGFEYKEDIRSGARAALLGGFTSIACMANTNPTADCPEVVAYMLEKAEKARGARVLPIGAVTFGLSGERLTDFEGLLSAGARAFSDDGRTVENEGIMREALLEGKRLGAPVIAHCEDMSLAGGAVNDGRVSRELGVKGIPSAAEENITARDIALAEELGAPVHIAHVSTKGSVAMIRAAKARGVKVTCETAPHYMLLTEDAVLAFGTNAKMSPPLRTESDRRAVLSGLVDGTIDAIATDHAPHSESEKLRPLDTAPFGIIGFETALSVSLKALLHSGLMPLSGILGKLSSAPAGILGLPAGSLKVGSPADIMIFDPDETRVIDASTLSSKSKNTPFCGMTLSGVVRHVFVGGECRVRDGRLTI